MGYTHYYTMKRDHDLKIKEISEDIAKLVAESDVPVGNGWGRGDGPYYADYCVVFNGARPEHHEPFSYPPNFSKGHDGGFTKTARKPYDEIVAAALLVMQHRLGDGVEIASDGACDNIHWQYATDLFRRTFPDRDVDALMEQCEFFMRPGSELTKPLLWEDFLAQAQEPFKPESFMLIPNPNKTTALCGRTVKSTGRPCRREAGHPGKRCISKMR